MKTKVFLFIGIGIMVILASCVKKNELTIRFTNFLTTDLPEEVVNIPVVSYNDSIGTIPEGQLPVFISGTDTLVSQCVDFNKDGKTDNILVLISLPAGSTREARVVYLPGDQYPVFKRMTNIRFARHVPQPVEMDTATRVQTTDTEVTSRILQMEGPAWENDKVGFRNYFDLRNGTDIFGKQTSEMVLDSVGLNRATVMPGGLNIGEIYHNLSPWGMDILKVGNSLGAGSVALMVNDSLFRIGDNGNGSFFRMYEGPLKSEFMFEFPEWKAGNETFNISQYISITAGKYRFMSSLVTGETNGNAQFVTGIVNMHSDSLYVEKVSPDYTALLTHAVQSEDTAMLTMALLIPDEELEGYGETRKTGEGITSTYYARLKTDAGVPATYWFYAFWATGNPEFGDMDNVLEILRRDAEVMEVPVGYRRID
jgi:hypothetical protein